ncbi:clan AA aspartic protease [Sphingomonas naphthae]|uniref:Clan AA aspartic protease n=1 Tax=Sphingomonas naphthae TaxID=1813468 RepID=A0ABY7TGW4_9SPHN|nr:clan AA aspartic protease [Sphingomonas naphthae]WCT72298.1 clan AA aspartic protease [Sphingomonas naphthae]
MGVVYAPIKLSNLLRDDLQPVEVDALVDSGAINLCIPEIVQRELGLTVKRTRVAQMADGSLLEVGIVEPVTVQFENRITTTTAMVLGNEVLLGAIAMQDMDVMIDPRNERLILPPDRPNFALAKVK